MVGELGGQGAAAAVEGEAHHGAGARVGVALHDRVRHRRARMRELHQHRGADQLGGPDGEGSGPRGRRGGAQRGHGDEGHRHAGLGVDQGRLDAALVLHEGRDRADQVGEHRCPAQLLGAAGDDRRHLDGVARLALALDEALQVLDGVVPAGVDLVELGGLATVAGRNGGPPEGHRGEVVEQARDARQVGLGRGPLDAGLEVDDLDAAAVARAPGGVVAEREGAARVAGPEAEVARRARHGREHDVGREGDDLAGGIDPAAVRGQDVERPLRGEFHAHSLEDVEGRLLQAVELGGRVIAHR